jgi:hypothetical protein
MPKSSDVPAPPPYQEITKERYNDLRFDALCHLSGLDSSKPAASSYYTNHTYFATDTHVLYRCTGTEWLVQQRVAQTFEAAVGPFQATANSVWQDYYTPYAGTAGFHVIWLIIEHKGGAGDLNVGARKKGSSASRTWTLAEGVAITVPVIPDDNGYIQIWTENKTYTFFCLAGATK